MTDRLPSLSARQVVRALERAGFAVSRATGSHCRLVHSDDPRRKVTVPIHGRDLPRGTLRAIIAQADMCGGIPEADVAAVRPPALTRY